MGISREQALDCFRSDDLVGIGMEADAVRRRLHPEGVVSYAVDRTIDASGAAEEDLLERICAEIRECVDLGGKGVRLACGPVAKGCEIVRLEGLLSGIRRRFPSLWLEGLSAAEVTAVARGCGIGLCETIARLKDAGLDSIAGDAAAVEAGSPQDWLDAHRMAHGLGMRTVATMAVGAGTSEQRVDLLEAVRRLQEETGGFAAFVPLCLPPGDTPRGAFEGPTAVEYLKTLAISRMFLDNVENVQSSGAPQGLKVLQMGLRFGANDAGSVAPEASRRSTAGPASKGRATEENLRRIIRDAGFKPVQRDMLYRTMYLN
jgi:cyclic dehypoxanthinyl futalosine synthase